MSRLFILVEQKNKMETYISILRGINVSGHKLIKMDALKKMFEDLNFKILLVHTFLLIRQFALNICSEF